MGSGPAAPLAGKHAARALLGFAMDAWLSGTIASGARVPSPWDAWWAAYRAAIALPDLAPGTRAGQGACPDCEQQATALASSRPPGHPGTGAGACGCLLRWAAAMRAPGPAQAWPPASLSLAMVKPGAPVARIRQMISAAFEILGVRDVMLTTADTRRMYPEAYGADYVRDRDTYLTSGPVTVLMLRVPDPSADLAAIKSAIRGQLGGGPLRNHLHMPDNPGEALADIAHFAGPDELADLYRRYDRGNTHARLAFYRSALGAGSPAPDRLPAAS
jgi:hypothetical protein